MTRLLYPSTLLVLASNLVPLIGVLFWGWDVFVLLMLYWVETVVIAFWTLLRVLIGSDFSRNFLGEVFSRLFFFAFFLVHSGGFMLGHFLFLWAFFSGRAGGTPQLDENFFRTMPADFWNNIVIANGLLIPLAISFVGRGIAFVIEMARLPLWQRLVGEDVIDRSKGALIGGLYGRIITMHLVIIVGAALAQKFGKIAPLVLLIAAKTAVDIWFFLRIDLDRNSPGPVERAQERARLQK